eukprot:4647125-Pleurochrysis_carterae.AAC.1
MQRDAGMRVSAGARLLWRQVRGGRGGGLSALRARRCESRPQRPVSTWYLPLRLPDVRPVRTRGGAARPMLPRRR